MSDGPLNHFTSTYRSFLIIITTNIYLTGRKTNRYNGDRNGYRPTYCFIDESSENRGQETSIRSEEGQPEQTQLTEECKLMETVECGSFMGMGYVEPAWMSGCWGRQFGLGTDGSDIVVDNCAICRNHIMDLCEFNYAVGSHTKVRSHPSCLDTIVLWSTTPMLVTSSTINS